MARFVRNPATNWGDLDTMAEGREEGQSKQALKEMIERKRRNDFVRKREFDMLRKLRSKSSTTEPGYGGRPSFFQSSYSSKPGDRAGTLKKIDEIEAQMSMHWWKNRGGDSRGAPTTLPPDLSPPPRQTRKPTNSPTATTMLLSTRLPDDASQPADNPPVGQVTPNNDLTATAAAALYMGEEESQENSAFSVSKFYALDVQELALNPEIEEAAIRYASGDDAATEQGLIDTLNSKSDGGSVDEWMTLFDFYRATGQSAAFDGRAIDFANRFSRSAPQWFSMPKAVSDRQSVHEAPAGQSDRAAWVADSDVDAHGVMLLSKVLDRTPQPWMMDWSPLQHIHANAIAPLLKQFEAWGNADVDLRFIGAKSLKDWLQQATPSGEKSTDPAIWSLRLAVLRVMGLGDDFELAALDFCVTYELSPPSWVPPVCHFKSVLPGREGGSAPNAGASSPTSQFATTQFLDSRPADSVLSDFPFQSALQDTPAELIGEIVGDPMEQLKGLDEVMTSTGIRDISCRHLIRVDFSAAGSILNWVSAHQAQGRHVRFVDVHRLVAAFFHVIGITEYAKVLTRDD